MKSLRGLMDDEHAFRSGTVSEPDLPLPNAPLRSYDVFDTALTRLVGLPTSVFLLLGCLLVKRGLWSGSGEQFAAARVAAEERARRHAPRREITFAAVYGELAHSFALDESDVDVLASEELQLEQKLLRAVPWMQRRISSERRQGYRHVFISDMYLPASVVQTWLRQLGVAQPHDRVWVSSDSGQTKGSGALFDVVAREAAATKTAWRHVGDNAWADVAAPRARGIEGELFDACHLTPFEKTMESFRGETCGLSSLLAGASRWTRLTAESGSEVDEAKVVLNDYAAQVAGPAVYAFVLWVLQTARREGIRRVWFMARDGQVMIPIAKIIARRLHIDVDVGYLYGGRQVMKLAALRAVDDEAIEWIAHGARFMTVADVLVRVGLEQDALGSDVRACGLPQAGLIGAAGVPKLISLLRRTEVVGRILEAAAQRRSDVLDYFRTCGLIAGERCCVVDIGWRATVVKAFDELIGRSESVRHTYLYFGLYSRPPSCDGLRMKGYMFDIARTHARGVGHDIGLLSALMEIFCQADHGAVLRVVRSADGFEPQCREENASSSGSWDVRMFQQRMVMFAESVLIDLCTNPAADLRGMVAALLHRGLGEPIASQVRALSSIGFTDDPGGSAPQSIARAYGWRDIPAAYVQGTWPWYGMNWWVVGARVLTPRPTQFLLRVAAKLGRIARPSKIGATTVDVALPGSRGADSPPEDACRLTRYEQQMERHASSTGGLASLLAGTSRWLRLNRAAEAEPDAALRDMAAGVAGPVLWAFVTWVLRTAQREGLRRICFTARDGQVMLRMARRIAPRLGIEVEMLYLYAGRQVVHLAGLHRIDERALKWMTGGAGVVSATAVLERVGLAPDDVADALDRHGIPRQGAIGWARKDAMLAFFRDSSVQAAVLAVAKRRREDMRGYFSACGLMGDEPCAIVDIGWRGSVLRSMFDILGPAHAERHRFLYFGLYGRPVDVPEARMSAFCFDVSGERPLGTAHDVPSLTSVMEIFCQADHGQVVHVEPSGGAHVVRLRPRAETPPSLWRVEWFQDCLEAFADAVPIQMAIDPDADLRPLCEQLLRALMTRPDALEARVLGSVQYVDDQAGTTSQPFARPYGLTDWRALVRTGSLPHHALAWWEQGAWVLTHPGVRLCLRAARKLGRLRHAARTRSALRTNGGVRADAS